MSCFANSQSPTISVQSICFQLKNFPSVNHYHCQFHHYSYSHHHQLKILKTNSMIELIRLRGLLPAAALLSCDYCLVKILGTAYKSFGRQWSLCQEWLGSSRSCGCVGNECLATSCYYPGLEHLAHGNGWVSLLNYCYGSVPKDHLISLISWRKSFGQMICCCGDAGDCSGCWCWCYYH